MLGMKQPCFFALLFFIALFISTRRRAIYPLARYDFFEDSCILCIRIWNMGLMGGGNREEPSLSSSMYYRLFFEDLLWQYGRGSFWGSRTVYSTYSPWIGMGAGMRGSRKMFTGGLDLSSCLICLAGLMHVCDGGISMERNLVLDTRHLTSFARVNYDSVPPLSGEAGPSLPRGASL